MTAFWVLAGLCVGVPAVLLAVSKLRDAVRVVDDVRADFDGCDCTVTPDGDRTHAQVTHADCPLHGYRHRKDH